MEIETPAPLSVAPPTPAIPEEIESVENNLQIQVDQQPISSPLNNSGQMLPPDEIPASKSNEPVNNENLVIFNMFNILKTIYFSISLI